MKLSDLELTHSLILECKTSDNEEMTVGEGLINKGINNSTFIFNSRSIEVIKNPQQEELEFYLSGGNAHIAAVVQNGYKGSFLMDVKFFAGPLLELNDLNILVNEKYSKGLGDWKKLPEECYLDIQITSTNKNFFVIQTSIEDVENSDELNNLKDFSFSIQHPQLRIDVVKLKEEYEENTYYTTRRVTKRKNNNPQPNFFLVKGSLDFSNERKFSSKYTQHQINELSKDNQSYLDEWNKYSNQQGENLLKKARELGAINYDSFEFVKADIYRFILNEKIDLKSYSRLNLDISSQKPLFVEKPDLGWTDYLLEKNQTLKKKNTDKDKEKEEVLIKTIEGCEIFKYDKISIDLKIENIRSEIPKTGFVFISTRGDETQLERQQKASELLKQGKSGIPHLGVLLEQGATLPQKQYATKGLKLKAHTYKKIFTNPPNQRQRDAIDVALQSPDISLIQGPPGTGKTTVIAAILEQLNIMQNKTKATSGQVLLSSYQHDAVINLIDRLKINSIPTFKFGKRSGSEDYTENIERWTNNVKEKLISHTPELKRNEDEKRISEAYALYMINPSSEEKIRLLNAISETPSLTKDITNDILALKENETKPIKSSDKHILAIRRLRIKEVSYADDGRENLLEVYNLLKDDLNTDESKFLKKTYIANNITVEDLSELAKIKKRLLLKYSPSPAYFLPEIEDAVISIYKRALKCIRINKSKASRTNQLLEQWLEDLSNNPTAIKEAIKDCNFAYSSSAQQSKGRDITKAKEDPSNKIWFLYDTVIIDEAARATPPDLLIPMCQAAKRIILVGDHRQLPHTVEEEILKELENSEYSEKREEYLKLSLFEYLFTRLKELEKEDGIRRTVTLDSQYRMHPLLGEFASNQFYKQYQEGFDSPRPAEDFSYMLPGIENIPAIWVDVPVSEGYEEVSDNSICRQGEINKIVEKITLWKDAILEQNLTIGVISFYSAQVKKIKAALKKTGIPLTSDNGKEIIRVGSVDSFQGMEFDIVFLSVVRSNKKNIYGFLKSDNRLCVSMTRQKKALIVVGDRQFCTTSKAKKQGNIKQISEFYNLCSTHKLGMVE